MMVLTMYVIGNGTTDGHQGSSRCDVGEPAMRKNDIDDFADQNASLALQDTGISVKADEAIEMAGMKQHAVLIETHIAIASAVPVSQH